MKIVIELETTDDKLSSILDLINGDSSQSPAPSQEPEVTVEPPPAPEILKAPSQEPEVTVEPPPAPEVPTPPPAVDEVDSEGMRWDARIHSANKTKLADGTWRLKRGVSLTLVDQVKAEQGLLKIEDTGKDEESSTKARSYSELTTLVTELLVKDGVAPNKIEKIVAAHGFDGIPLLSEEDPMVIGAVYEALEGLKNEQA